MTRRRHAAAALAAAIAGASSCAPDRAFFTIAPGFAEAPLLDDCAATAAAAHAAGIWRLRFLFYGPYASHPYPDDELWILELTTYSNPLPDALNEVELACGAERRSLRFLHCGDRVYVDPQGLAGWHGRGSAATPCTLRIRGKAGTRDAYTFAALFIRESMRPALAPVTSPDRIPPAEAATPRGAVNLSSETHAPPARVGSSAPAEAPPPDPRPSQPPAD
ncbi:MAG: hypothetical protein R3A79_13975 [Nannocystaceae bacterium]